MITLFVLALVGCGSSPEKPATSDSASLPDVSDSSSVPSTTPTGSTGSTADTGGRTLDPPTGDPATVPLAGACPVQQRVGGFRIEALDAFTLVDGLVRDAVLPLDEMREVDAEGGCLLLLRDVPFCDPACVPGETCDWDGSCIPYPEALDLGVVTVAGLAADVVMEPAVPGYRYFDTTLPHPAWAPGELVELRTGGGALDPMVMRGVGVEPLELLEASWIVPASGPLALQWGPPAGDVRSHVHLVLTIDQHGLTPVSVVCEFPDTGAAEVPEGIVRGLVDAGVSGFPNATLTRRTADSADTPGGCLDFVISSPRVPEVRVEGFVPCVSDDDCPTGMSCNLPLELCE